jgi:hypothetical protein
MVTPKRVEVVDGPIYFKVNSKGELDTNTGKIGNFNLSKTSLTATQKSEEKVLNLNELSQEDKKKLKDHQISKVFNFLTSNLSLSADRLQIKLSDIIQGRSDNNDTVINLAVSDIGLIQLSTDGLIAGLPYFKSSDITTLAEGEEPLAAELIYPFKLSLDGNISAQNLTAQTVNIKEAIVGD